MFSTIIGSGMIILGADLAITQGSQYFWSQQQQLLHAQHIGSHLWAALGVWLFVVGVIVVATEFSRSRANQ